MATGLPAAIQALVPPAMLMVDRPEPARNCAACMLRPPDAQMRWISPASGISASESGIACSGIRTAPGTCSALVLVGLADIDQDEAVALSAFQLFHVDLRYVHAAPPACSGRFRAYRTRCVLHEWCRSPATGRIAALSWPDMDAEDLEQAAINAEYASGRREATEAEAKRHILVRLGRMTLGFLALIAGIVMLPLPGPGWLVIALGLGILAEDVAWADRVLRLVRRKVPGLQEEGPIPRSVIIVGITLGLAAGALSLWFATR